MSQLFDNPGQGHRGGQEYGEDNFHKSGRNQDAQRYQTTPEEEKLKQAHHEALKQEQQRNENDDDEKFSPGQDDDYDPEDFNTD
ncbi:hypothetical protein CHU92_09925 [Flavobacterium cyanobacteriorum]|uniref:Uncharacterized protein n=1 Tax=Flavobacterium cyanobacteriorum TaxID=2022802 RepID=A0A255Z4F3_9FLAO|nr:hypothetical protein [Flavobacterium cyanobacteriorum]OYQ36329.1 hypothetical protein CHU92_09925 [Flavobacterium cyanobacteriorum]